MINRKHKYNDKISLYLQLMFLFFVFLFLLNRIQYGIDFTDESWYVAEPYVVAQGWSIPFFNNVTQTPGFTIPLSFAYKIFCFVNNGTEGIVFFSRFLYLLFALFASGVTVYLYNKFTDFQMPLITIAALFVSSNISCLFDINYNTIGVIYMPLIFATIFVEYQDSSYKSIGLGCLAGILATRAVLATPQIIVGLLIVLFFLCIQKKWMRVIGILLGCIIASMIVLGPIIISYGFDSLCTWFQHFFSQGYFYIESRTSTDRNFSYLYRLFRPAFLTFGIMYIFRLFQRKMNVKNTGSLEMFLNLVVLGNLFCGVIYSLSHGYDRGAETFSFYTWYLPFIYSFYTSSSLQFLKKIVVLFSFSSFCVYIFASFTNIYGFGSRHYWLFAPIVFLLCLIYRSSKNSTNVFKFHSYIKMLLIVALASLSFLKLSQNYLYVYRDKPISQLSTKITEGIWKELYTTEERAKSVIELEKYLKTITHKEDDILCLDWASFGYLMINGKMCSPTALDANGYTYRVNKPDMYFRHFSMERKAPTKIIYIDYKRDKCLSIEDTTWKFNDFVKKYYIYNNNEFENKIFRVKVYSLKDCDGAVNMVLGSVKPQ